MQPTKEITLSPKLSILLLEFRNSLKETHDKNQMLNNRLNDILTGICLNEGILFEEMNIAFNDDMTKIIATPRETIETENVEATPPTKAVKRKLK